MNTYAAKNFLIEQFAVKQNMTIEQVEVLLKEKQNG